MTWSRSLTVHAESSEQFMQLSPTLAGMDEIKGNAELEKTNVNAHVKAGQKSL